MKKILWSIILFTLIISCDQQELDDNYAIHETLSRAQKVNGYYISVIEYDSCEYLISGRGHSQMMTHKGNCKFCAIRNKK